jgi:hypothetical protein
VPSLSEVFVARKTLFSSSVETEEAPTLGLAITLISAAEAVTAAPIPASTRKKRVAMFFIGLSPSKFVFTNALRS